MSVNCPYCSHAIKLKSTRAGRFQPRCPGCGRAFLLVVSADVPPGLQVASLPVKSAPVSPGPEATAGLLAVPPAALPEATAAPGTVGIDSSDFSVAAAAVVGPGPDVTSALEQSSPPTPREGRPAAFEATAADLSGAAASAEDRPGGPDLDLVPRQALGKYEIIRQLGRGGMGAVYLARQVSLDRPVALKVMNPGWAQNPNFLVRFTREAYAAAQLVHHNVVQVYDIGEHAGAHYFSMEYVSGRSLGELLKAKGKLAAEEAAGYILQAARGLEFAHERGMIHRDVKPDNLLLNDQGVVKVADLGLVRTPGMEEPPVPRDQTRPPNVSAGQSPWRSLGSLSNVTLAGQAMGTPAYMAPEQARDATKVDQRADVYSLGCTLCVLVTGRPVFKGSNALEVITAHAFEPVVRPDTIVKGLPRALADIIVKMIAKKPEDRYASMTEVIRALEDFLGLEGAARLVKAEQHLRTLEQAVKAFEGAGLAALRTPILLGFFGGCAALFVLLVLFGFWRPAGGVLGLGLMTALAHLVVHGLAQRTYLFARVRGLVLSSGWRDFLKLGAAGVLFVLVLGLFGLFWVWLLAALLAVGLAVAFQYALDRRIARERGAALEKVEHLLKTLRLRGLSEEALEEFVCKNAGEHWEEFFEALFGYEAKRAARATWAVGPRGGRRPRFAAWRDPLVRWLDRYQRVRQEARARQHLQAVEQANLVAQGVNTAQAREQAGRVAEAMVQVAAELRQEPPQAIPVVASAAPLGATLAPDASVTVAALARPIPPRRVNVQDIYQMAAAPASAPRRRSRLVGDLLGTVFGSGIRFTIGAGLLVIALCWLYTRGLLPGSSHLEEGWRWRRLWELGQTADPLSFPLLPEVVLQALCSLGAALAGAALVLSAIWRSWKIGLLTMLGAAIMVIGPVSGQVPEVGQLGPFLLCLAAGGALVGLGFLFGRDT